MSLLDAGIAILLAIAEVGETGLAQSERRPTVQEGQDEIQIETVRRLIGELGSPQYQTRERAERSLIALGERLIEVLDKIEPPSSPEIQVRLDRIRKTLVNRGITADNWILLCQPLDGESLDLRRSRVIQFLSDGSFEQVDQPGGGEKKWQFGEDNETIIFTYNRGYATYSGRFVDDSVIKGSAENVKGKKWQFTLRRKQH